MEQPRNALVCPIFLKRLYRNETRALPAMAHDSVRLTGEPKKSVFSDYTVAARKTEET